jgi:type II secretory pathway predicted ATPase ExeA
MRNTKRSSAVPVLCGVVGCGKTALLRRIRNTLAQDGEILVSQSLSVDKISHDHSRKAIK